MKKESLPRWPSRLPDSAPTAEHAPDTPPLLIAHDHLVESLSVFLAHPNLAPTQEKQLEEVIAEDAKQLAAQLVPPKVAKALEITSPYSDEQPPIPPSLNDTYLLARALDATGDPVVRDALGYILESDPPVFSETLQQAYNVSSLTGDPLLMEHNRIRERQDSEIDLYMQNWSVAQEEAKKRAA